MSHPNPFKAANGQWFFFDETAEDHGPYPTEALARELLDDYCKYLDTGESDYDKILAKHKANDPVVAAFYPVDDALESDKPFLPSEEL